MAIQKEPGQKGVNWSNIAVGEFVACDCTRIHVLNSLLGGIMNMVNHYCTSNQSLVADRVY
jgi:hypothetical protein